MNEYPSYCNKEKDCESYPKLCNNCTEVRNRQNLFKQKPEQTYDNANGWKCASPICSAKCVVVWRHKPKTEICIFHGDTNRTARWVPFYGKVVDD